MQPMRYRMYAAMDKGSRKDQQDAVNSSFPELQQDLGVLCVLSDGMGGLSEGGEASNAIVKTMVSTFHQSSVSDTPEQILLRGCWFSQQAVRKMQNKPGESGATLAAVLIRNERCSFLSVGDSRIYLLRDCGLIQLTRDMNRLSRIDRQIGMGRLPEEARSDAKAAGLSAYVGMEKLEQVDRSSHSFPLIPGDRILMVSDGVYGTLEEWEMAEAMYLPGQEAAVGIINRVLDKQQPNQDNCSAVVIDCESVV